MVIYGAGDQGRSQARIFAAAGREVAGFLDDRVTQPQDGRPVLGRGEDAPALARERPELSFSFAVGYRSFADRAARFEGLRASGVPLASCIHPSAVLDPAAEIGPGAVVFAGAVVEHGTVLAENVLLNTAAVVAHDCRVEAHAFLAPGSVLAGFVEVGRCAFVGLGARVIERVRIGEGAWVAAGAVVLEDVPPFTLVAGVPARVKKEIPPFATGAARSPG